jgi:hypothetical protein
VIEIERIQPVYGEVMFLDMHPLNGRYEPLLGYIVLEQSQAAVDMLGNRLIHISKVDLKSLRDDGAAPVSGWESRSSAGEFLPRIP